MITPIAIPIHTITEAASIRSPQMAPLSHGILKLLVLLEGRKQEVLLVTPTTTAGLTVGEVEGGLR